MPLQQKGPNVGNEMDMPEGATAFAIFDSETGNQLGSFSDPNAASEALAALVEDDPAQASTLVLTFFDKRGHAIGSQLANELLPRQ